MSASLLGRLFGVPLVIVSLIVGSAMLVVLLFGDIVADRERSVDSLLRGLESASGEKMAGAILLPRDKELWQTARELALRLEDKENELGPGELDEVVSRLSKLLERDLARSEFLSPIGRQRMHFFVTALSHTGRAEAVEVLLKCLDDPAGETRREALMALAQLHDLAVVKEALGRIGEAIEDVDPVVQTVACWVMSHLASPSDEAVIAKLERACGFDNREVSWNAALTLARLGNARGKGILFDLLDRAYWEEKVPVRVRSKEGRLVENPMPAQAVDHYLMAAIDAASCLEDAELGEAIEALQSDRSPKVAARARSAIEKTRASDGND